MAPAETAVNNQMPFEDWPLVYSMWPISDWPSGALCQPTPTNFGVIGLGMALLLSAFA